MIIKILSAHLRKGWQLVNMGESEFSLSTFAFSKHLKNQLTSGKISLSLKDGKKRRLVKGRLTVLYEDDKVLGRCRYYRFYPNNLIRFQALLARQ